MADIIELILADHARIRRLLAEIETILAPTDGTDWRAELPGRWEMLAALLEVHADAAEEIGFPVLFGRVATLAWDNAKATHGDIRRRYARTRLYPAVRARGG
jgi:Hemerythrin HHE cation binding domain